jgi:hypothetical protein
VEGDKNVQKVKKRAESYVRRLPDMENKQARNAEKGVILQLGLW